MMRFLIALATLVLCQSTSVTLLPKPVELFVSKQVTVSSVPPFGWFGFPKTDDDGNLYFHPDTGNYNAMNVLRVSQDGDSSAVYASDGEREKNCAFSGFAVTRTGRVWMLAICRDTNTYVYSFDGNGKTNGRVQLEVPSGFYPTESFAVFESGAIFVSGYFDKRSEKTTQGKSFTAIFEPSGKLRKQLLRIVKDVPLSERASSFIENAVTVAPDDSLYFLSSDAIIQVNQFGKQLRTIKYEKPDENALATKLEISGNYGCIWLNVRKKGEPSKAYFLVVNLATGEPFRLYRSNEDLGQNAVSFSYKEGFTFLRPEHGILKLLQAQLR